MSETTENVGNNRKCRKQQKMSETTENVGNNGKRRKTTENIGNNGKCRKTTENVGNVGIGTGGNMVHDMMAKCNKRKADISLKTFVMIH